MKGELNYKEYSCPCGGRVERRKDKKFTLGFFKVITTFVYYYECMDCEILSELYECDITEQVKRDRDR